MKQSAALKEWFFFSIYYSPEDWWKLFQRGIIPYFDRQEALISKRIIHFGNNRGAYIGLTCQIDMGFRKDFLVDFEHYFNAFIGREPSAPDIPRPTQGLYIDFSPNTLCHSVHNFLPTTKFSFNQEYQDLWHDSTSHLIKMFKDSDFDQESLFMVATYLNLLLLLSNEDLATQYTQQCVVGFDNSAHMKTMYESLYGQAETSLREILSNCKLILQGISNEELQPLRNWYITFNSFLSNLTDKDQFNLKEAQYELLVNIIGSIRDQLGINNRSLLDYFIYRLLKP